MPVRGGAGFLAALRRFKFAFRPIPMNTAPRRSHYASSVLVFVIAFVVLSLLMDRAIGAYDESLILTGARRMQSGELVHRDFYFVYGPASIWVVTKLWLLGPMQFVIARIYGLATASAIVSFIFFLLVLRTRPWVAVTFTLASLLWLISFKNYLYPTFQCALLMLLGSAILLHRTEGECGKPFTGNPAPQRRLSLIVAGACSGAASLFRYDAGIVIALSQLVWLALPMARRSPRPERVASGIAYACGYFAIIALPAAYYLAQASSLDIWGDTVASSTTYYFTHRSLPFPDFGGVLRDPREGGVYIPLLAVAVAAAVWGPSVWKRPEAADVSLLAVRRFALLMGISAVLLYYKGLVRAEPLHFVLSIIPATLLLAVCVDRLWIPSRFGRVAAIMVTLVTTAPAGRAAAGVAVELFQTPTLLVGGWMLAKANLIRQIDDPIAVCQPVPKNYLSWMSLAGAQISSFVRANSDPRERVFVATGRTDRFVVNDLALYFVMDRLPGTHWHAFDPGLQTRRDIQERMIIDLERSGVRWIVRDPSFDRIIEPNASSRSSGVFVLDRWISSHYRIVGRAPPITVWLRNDQTAPRLDRGPPVCRLNAP